MPTGSISGTSGCARKKYKLVQNFVRGPDVDDCVVFLQVDLWLGWIVVNPPDIRG